MTFGKKKVLAVFLERDNLKFLAYSGKLRSFAGQITFSSEVLRDGFIADNEKFSSQVKMAFAQKPALHEAEEVILFISPDKAFTKTLASSDSIDSFVHGLPYFKEELVINSYLNKEKTKTTYVAFEKKLVEDLQRPFMEMGKKVEGVKSLANILTSKFAQLGKYLLLVPLEKDVVVIAAQDGTIVDLSVVRNEVFAARLPEFKASHEINANTAYTLGTFPSNLITNLNLQLTSLAPTDVYDLIFNNATAKESKIKLPNININSKYLFLIGAILIGAALVFAVVKNFPKSSPKVVTPVVTSTPTPTPTPEPKLTDYPINIFNGTSVGGEAGKLAQKLEGLGYDVKDTKNATTTGFIVTRLRVTSVVPEVISQNLKTALLDSYQSVNIEMFASSSSKTPIEIIIGKKK